MSDFFLKKDMDKNLSLYNENISRYEKLLTLRQQGIAFPNNFRKNVTCNQLYLLYKNKNNEELKKLNISVSIAGRIISKRIMGKASFIVLQDFNGNIQLYITCNSLSKDQYNKQFKKLDIGDICGAQGILFKTKTNTLSIFCSEINLLVKSLHSLPNKFHGLVDQEIKCRQRYLDLISNNKSRHIFKIRSDIIWEIRCFMQKRNFIEVETPMMHTIPGGAVAQPFITYHNKLDINLYLRISPELYLKRLIVGGFEKIFEINRSFRNEGLSTKHNPEFTMIELYIAYADYNDLMIFIEELFQSLSKIILGDTKLNYNNKIIYFDKPFIKMTMIEAILIYNPDMKLEMLSNLSYVSNFAKSLNIQIDNTCSIGYILNKIFECTVENKLFQPTFITSYPVDISPLARCNNQDVCFTDRFELFIGGYEIGNGFSELNDPEEQSSRFFKQLKNKNISNDKISSFYDSDYITALEYGMPPTAGLGIGIDRIVMLFTNTNTIRDVILFPTLRPH